MLFIQITPFFEDPWIALWVSPFTPRLAPPPYYAVPLSLCPSVVLTRAWVTLSCCVCLSSLLDSTLRGEGLDSVPHSVPVMLPDTVDAQKVGSELKPLL